MMLTDDDYANFFFRQVYPREHVIGIQLFAMQKSKELLDKYENCDDEVSETDIKIIESIFKYMITNNIIPIVVETLAPVFLKIDSRYTDELYKKVFDTHLSYAGKFIYWNGLKKSQVLPEHYYLYKKYMVEHLADVDADSIEKISDSAVTSLFKAMFFTE